MSYQITSRFTAAAVAGLLALGATAANAQTPILKADVPGPGSVNNTIFIVLAKIWKKHAGITLQVNEGQTLTRSGIKLGQGRIDILPFPPVGVPWMRKGVRMYKKNPKVAQAAVKNMRLINTFVGGVYHGVVWENSDIKTYADLKGKRVFTGPPAGGATITAEGLVRAVTGYNPGKEYNVVRLPWGSGVQAMQDGKLDVFIRPAGLGAATINQLGVERKFRLLDVGDARHTEAWKKYQGPAGRVTVKIPAGTYSNQTNNSKDIFTNGFMSQIVVRKDLDDDLVYKLTKTMFDNIKEMHDSAVTLKLVGLDDPFTSGNVPLHPGALRFYKEVGKTIPKSLLGG
ncbi:MAG: TAXI family TRAP transporter solute-binding subunit [Proteobacteria bacterium]|nr:TAXI family TRAP transporter solute-binding subunit [Pseudomonadota bacterium]